MFPHEREVPEELLKELTGIMIHAGIGGSLSPAADPTTWLIGHLDDMTSHRSTSVYTGEQLEKFISYVGQIGSIGGADGYSACVVG